jgi:hypothetical protein
MAVPRGFSSGGDRAPSAPVIAAVEATHGAWPKGSTLPCTMQNATLGARGASPREVAHAERRWRIAHARRVQDTPRRGSATAHGGEGTLLAAGRLAAT